MGKADAVESNTIGLLTNICGQLNRIKGKQKEHPILVEDILNGMSDWVRVLDLDCNIIYINKAMEAAIQKPIVGKKCYEAFDRNEPCENCISRRSMSDVKTYEKEEVLKDKIFSVMSSPVKDPDGDVVAVVEVLRDVTELKQIQEKVVRQNRKLNNDLDMARKLQLTLLPSELHEERIKFSFIYEPSETLGGDFIDIFKIDKDRIGLYIADVSGHGVSSSLLTIFLRSSINKNIVLPSKALEELYKEFNSIGFDTDLYITIFYSIIDLKNMTLTYCNAGHNISPIVFSSSKYEILEEPGVPISNWIEKPNYIDRCTSLDKGDRIFYSSDGIIEVKNNSKEEFGEKRILHVLLNNQLEPDRVLKDIFTDACDFAGIKCSSQIYDDITMAILEIT